MSPVAPSAFGTNLCDPMACSTNLVTFQSAQHVGNVQSSDRTFANRSSKPAATCLHMVSASVTSTPRCGDPPMTPHRESVFPGDGPTPGQLAGPSSEDE